MLELQPRDKRGYFMLPQAPEDSGYYVYGLFNDKDIPRVQHWLNHDDHFHVDIRATPK
ncbi:hypothetical protein [Janthinobacterium sp. RB2R34]|uniref:hypothetical protein n=1 Tax=Janthinobacterium sp. RB2R34 TaxID=3424193 RepID=UPI003F296C21